MKRILFTSIIILLISIDLAFAQKEEEKKYLLSASISFPSGDFGDDSGKDAGLAKTGFGISGSLTLPSGSPGLGWTFSASFLLNGIDDTELKQELREMLYYFGYEGNIDLDFGYWVNVPILAGLKYKTPLSPTSDFYFIGQVGINFVKGPTMKLSLDDGFSSKTTYDVVSDFAFAVGGGFIINQKFTVELKYLGLGEPEIEGTSESGSESVEIEGIDQPISILLISLGINL